MTLLCWRSILWCNRNLRLKFHGWKSRLLMLSGFKCVTRRVRLCFPKYYLVEWYLPISQKHHLRLLFPCIEFHSLFPWQQLLGMQRHIFFHRSPALWQNNLLLGMHVSVKKTCRVSLAQTKIKLTLRWKSSRSIMKILHLRIWCNYLFLWTGR